MVTFLKIVISVACVCLFGLAACSGEMGADVHSGPDGVSGNMHATTRF